MPIQSNEAMASQWKQGLITLVYLQFENGCLFAVHGSYSLTLFLPAGSAVRLTVQHILLKCCHNLLLSQHLADSQNIRTFRHCLHSLSAQSKDFQKEAPTEEAEGLGV